MLYRGYETTWYETTWVRNDLGTKRLGYETTWVRNDLGTKSFLGTMLTWVRKRPTFVPKHVELSKRPPKFCDISARKYYTTIGSSTDFNEVGIYEERSTENQLGRARNNFYDGCFMCAHLLYVCDITCLYLCAKMCAHIKQPS